MLTNAILSFSGRLDVGASVFVGAGSQPLSTTSAATNIVESVNRFIGVPVDVKNSRFRQRKGNNQSRNEFLQYVPMNIGQPHVPSTEPNRQTLMVDAEQV